MNRPRPVPRRGTPNTAARRRAVASARLSPQARRRMAQRASARPVARGGRPAVAQGRTAALQWSKASHPYGDVYKAVSGSYSLLVTYNSPTGVVGWSIEQFGPDNLGDPIRSGHARSVSEGKAAAESALSSLSLNARRRPMPATRRTARPMASRRRPAPRRATRRTTALRQGERVSVVGRKGQRPLRGVVAGRGQQGRYLIRLANGRTIERSAQFIRRTAEENPGTPVGWAIDSEEASQAPAAFSEVETLGDLYDDDVELIGAGPETDVSPDAIVDVEGFETVGYDGPEFDDVEGVVSGTDIEDEESTFETVPYAEAPTTEVFDPVDAFTAQRLARLRIEAGIEQGDDLVIAQRIAQSTSTRDARREIVTLSKVLKGGNRQASPAQRRRLVPRSAGGRKTTPSLRSTEAGLAGAVGSPSSDEFLFEV